MRDMQRGPQSYMEKRRERREIRGDQEGKRQNQKERDQSSQ